MRGGLEEKRKDFDSMREERESQNAMGALQSRNEWKKNERGKRMRRRMGNEGTETETEI